MNKVEDVVMLSNYVLVSILEDSAVHESKSSKGIIVSTNKKDAEKDVAFAEVIAVGEGYEREDGSIRLIYVDVGEIIMYESVYGEKVTLEGEEYYIIPDTAIFAVSRG